MNREKPAALAAGFQHELCQFTKRGNLDKVQKLLDRNVNTGTVGSAATKLGRAALLSAIVFNQSHVFSFLLDRGAEVGSTAQGKPALIWAIAYRRTDLANILLDKGADPAIEDSIRYQNALFWAARLGLYDISKRIANSGQVDINARDDSGRTALIEAAIAGGVSIVEALIDAGAAVDLKDYRFGWPALAWSIKQRKTNVLLTLLKRGASLFGNKSLSSHLR